MLRIAEPSIDEEEIDAVAEVLRSGYLVQGQHVAAFEEAVALRTGSAHAVAVSSCTSALHLSLVALGIGRGDAVAVPAYSWPATINAVALCGARPTIVDIDPGTFGMDPHGLAERIRSDRVSAILPVHLFGGMASIEKIAQIADAAGVPIVEDAACALGATMNGIPAGRTGRAGCFSFHPRKAVTTGEGGVVVTDDKPLARRLRALRNHGLDPSSAVPEFILPGYNARMTDFQGAMGLVQMGKLDRIVAARRRLARRYDQLLARTSVTTPVSASGACHAYQSYVVLLPEDAVGARPAIIAELREAGIESTIGTYALPFIRWVREKYGYEAADFPVVSRIERRALSLPLHERMSEQDQERVAACLLALLDHCLIA